MAELKSVVEVALAVDIGDYLGSIKDGQIALEVSKGAAIFKTRTENTFMTLPEELEEAHEESNRKCILLKELVIPNIIEQANLEIATHIRKITQLYRDDVEKVLNELGYKL